MQKLVVGLSIVLAGASAFAQRYEVPRPRAPEGAPAGPGRLRNRAQGMCLDVEGWNAQGNGNVLLWECNDDPDQTWAFTPGGELTDAVGGVCLDAAGYDGRAGANVDVYRCERVDDQRWVLVPRGGGSFELHNRKSGMCLDVAGRDGKRGDNVLLWSCDGGADQRWWWEPAAPRHVVAPPPRPVRDPPPPVIDPSVDQPPPSPIGREELRALRRAIDGEAASRNKLMVVEQAARAQWFLVAQAKELLGLLPFSADKLRGLELLAPRLLDGQNSFALYDAFAFSGDKDKARAILQRRGY